MVKVDESLTRQVANLARLELSDQEVTVFTAQVGKIIQYVEQLQEADVRGIEPMTHPLDLTAPLREDVARPSPVDGEGRPKVLQAAPETLDDGFKVPPIL